MHDSALQVEQIYSILPLLYYKRGRSMNVKSVATLLLMIPLVSAVSHAQPLNITLTRSYAGEPILYRRLRLGPVTISPYGYIKYELFYDSRQNIGSREVETHLFPLPILPDICGRDTNAHAKFQMSIIETRAGVKFKGPSWGSLKAIGLIEGDFRGVSELTLQTLRLRHAFGRIEWDTGSFLFGQYWHPMVAEECFPHTVSINRGVPIESRARNPQLRVTERWGDI
jgi:hypothetical protein